jgi:starch synthase
MGCVDSIEKPFLWIELIMRVCLINLWDRGGMLNYASQLANGLSRQPGIELVVVLPQQGLNKGSALFEPAVNLRSTHVITNQSFRELIHLPAHFFRMVQFPTMIKSLHPDVIHITAAHVWLIFALPRLAQHFPIVSTLHDIEPHPGIDRTFRKKLEIRTLVRYSMDLFVHGQGLKDQLSKLYPQFAKDSIHVIPHGDYAFFTRWSSGIPEEGRTILFFGRIRDYKGLPLLYDAYKRVLNVIPNARLIIAGDGSLGSLQAQFEGIPNCEIHNRYISDEEVSSFFERASIIVCPYTEASQSGVVPVAYAFKKPVIATHVGCLPESVDHGKTGILVPPGDSQALADEIISLIQDPVRRRELGDNGYRKMIDELGWDKIADRTKSVYGESIRNFRTGKQNLA